MAIIPLQMSAHGYQHGKHRNQNHIDQRAGGDAPELRAGTLGRINISYAAKQPEDDVVSFAADRTAGELMTKFVRQHNRE